jgi:hypothetical protein
MGMKIKKWIKYKILLDKFKFSGYWYMPSGKKWEKVVWFPKMRGLKPCSGVDMNTP